MYTNVEGLSCREIEAMEYFYLLDMSYDNRNAVTKNVSPTVQLFSIWTVAQISEHVIELQRLI